MPGLDQALEFRMHAQQHKRRRRSQGRDLGMRFAVLNPMLTISQYTNGRQATTPGAWIRFIGEAHRRETHERRFVGPGSSVL